MSIISLVFALLPAIAARRPKAETKVSNALVRLTEENARLRAENYVLQFERAQAQQFGDAVAYQQAHQQEAQIAQYHQNLQNQNYLQSQNYQLLPQHFCNCVPVRASVLR